MKKILLVISIALLLVGCSSKSVNVPTTQIEKETIKKAYTGVRAPNKLLGVRIACGEKRTEWGYTQEICGDDWGRELIIDWGNDQ
jgi:uncharacterized protein YceK